MTRWHDQPMVAFDLETTSAHPDTARIVTAVIIELAPGNARITEWLIAPDIDIPAGATAIHGITTERAREDGQDPEGAIFEITGKLGLHLGRGTPVVGMNLAYDLTVLDRECRRHSIDTLTRRMGDVEPVIDIYVLDKQIDRYRKGKRTLTALAATYGITLDEAHNAAADALASARIAWKIAEAHPDLQIDPKALHDMQVGWRHEQCLSLQAYFRKTDPTATVNPDWPIQTLPTAWTAELVDPQEEEGVA